MTPAATDQPEFSWTVKTQKNLTVSGVIFFSLFDDQAILIGNSHYFNITGSVGSDTSTIPAAIIYTSTPDLPQISTFSTWVVLFASTTVPSPPDGNYPGSGQIVGVPTAADASSTGRGFPTNVTVPTSNSNSISTGLPTSVTVGIAVAIPGSIVLGVAAGYILFKRRRRHSASLMGTHAEQDMPGGQWGLGSSSRLWGQAGGEVTGKQRPPIELSASPVAELPASQHRW